MSGKGSGRIATTPDELVAFVSEASNDIVRVIDLERFVATDTLAAGRMPGDLCVSPDGRRLYVANAGDISVTDLELPAEVLRINVNGTPGGIVIAPDGQRAFVSISDRGAVGVLDVVENRFLEELALAEDRTTSIHLAPDGDLYSTTTTSLVEIDPERNLVVRSLKVGEETSALGLTPDGAWAYVGAVEPNTFVPGLAVVNLATWEVAGRIRGLPSRSGLPFVDSDHGSARWPGCFCITLVLP